MSEDRPLTEFGADEDAAESDDTDTDIAADDGDDDIAADEAADEPAADEAAGSPVDADAEPAVPTYRWQPEGATCAACGATTERQWRDDEGFVCADCKSW